MAIPRPRSYPAILGTMTSTVSGRTGIDLRAGDPTLSILEASAHSDLRSSVDLLQMLALADVDRAVGDALDRIGQSEKVERPSATNAYGTVTFADSRYVRQSSKIYQGLGGLPAGGTTVYVENGLFLTAGLQFYIGRGTTNYEGPFTVQTSTNSSGYWTIVTTTPTTRYHNPGEDVVLAQGGIRTIPTGTTIQTGVGPSGSRNQYQTNTTATIPDGEVSVSGVKITALLAGSTQGNASALSINSIVSLPFTGATVSNPAPVTTGTDTYLDDAYRELIKTTRATRSKGTALAIRNAVRNATSLDENRKVVSSQLVVRQGEPSTLYIDDGTGYEETDLGIASETLVEAATGGEQYFSLAYGRPAAKAFVTSVVAGPYALIANSALSVNVGGVSYTHTFATDDFVDISHANPYEVVHSINANPLIGFSARTAGSGTLVVLVAKADTNEDIQVVTPSSGVNSNTVFGFPTNRKYSLYLYKNDRLLTKDGQIASVSSYTAGAWSAVSSGATLLISVDGVVVTDGTLSNTAISINDADFINAGTPYGIVAATNSLESWAAVLNLRIPGITATVANGKIVITSNLGASARASVSITGGTLATAIFGTSSSVGAASDYTFDRNLGMIKLVAPLTANDRVTVGSISTRSFYEAATPPSTLASTADSWWFVDGNSAFVSTPVGVGSVVSSGTLLVGWGSRVTLTAASWGTSIQTGDWAVIQDSAMPVGLQGAFRITNPTSTTIDIEVGSGIYGASYTLTEGKIKIVRSTAIPQKVSIGAGTNYTATTYAGLISLVGATAEAYRTTRLRVRTNTFGGDLFLASTNTVAATMGFVYGGVGVAHLGSLASLTMVGTPSFVNTSITGKAAGYVVPASATGWASDRLLTSLKPFRDDPTHDRESTIGYVTTLAQADTSTPRLYVNSTPPNGWLLPERAYPASPWLFTPDDQLSVLVDQDTTTKIYAVPMGRALRSADATYGSTITIKDYATGVSAYLAGTFGTGFDFKDFALWMPARVKSHPGTKDVLWRYNRLGPSGNNVRLAYGYPLGPSLGLAVESVVSSTLQGVTVRLPSGAARTGWTIHSGAKVGIAASLSASMYTYAIIARLVTSAATRTVQLPFVVVSGTFVATNVITGSVSGATATVVSNAGGILTITPTAGVFVLGETITSGGTSGIVAASAYGTTELTLTMPTPTGVTVTAHGIQPGDTIWLQSSSGSFATGAKTVTAATATTITFGDVPTAVSTGATIGTVSLDQTGESSFSGASIVVGDIFYIGGRNNIPATPIPYYYSLASYPTKIAATDGATWITTTLPFGPGSSGTTLDWTGIVDNTKMFFYPLAAVTTIASIATAVNALNTHVTAVALGTGSITSASYEVGELGPTVQYYALTDGIHWVKTTNTPANTTTDFTFTFKDTPNANLTGTGSDWANETIKLVPVTAKNTAEYMNIPAVSGLFSTSTVARSTSGNGIQIATSTIGGGGAVAVTGGTANGAAIVVQGSATSTGGSAFTLPVLTSDALSLSATQWVRLTNSVKAAKAVFTGTTALTSITSGVVVVSGTNAWTWANTATGTVSATWQVEKQGTFTCFADIAGTANLTGVSEGDWVIITTGNSLNNGQFRIVRVSGANFWVENANSTPDTATYVCKFVKYDSVMPGDRFVMDSTVWGTVGSWTVASLGATQDTFTVNPVGTATLANSGAVAALGANSPLIKVYESYPSTMIKRVATITNYPSVSTLVEVQFDTKGNGYGNLGEAFGTVLSPLDKLGFDSTIATGVDGYAHATGLLAEVNKIMYGDESQTSTYPGVAAAGSHINSSGPQVRRIAIGIAIRTNTSRNVIPQVQSAVASVINASPVGQPIALSSIVREVTAVGGITSVVITSPEYIVGKDLITIQPYEKPLVFDLASITVTVIGD